MHLQRKLLQVSKWKKQFIASDDIKKIAVIVLLTKNDAALWEIVKGLNKN